MVITDRLIWLHVPKTAGDATLAMFEQVQCQFRLVHGREDPRKHATLAEAYDQFLDIDQLPVIINLRRLPEVALSFFQHMKRHEPGHRFANGRRFGAMHFRDYLEYVVEHPESHSYDWHFEHFLGGRKPDHWLEVGRLEESFVEVIGAYHLIGAVEREAIRGVRENIGDYDRGLARWFRIDDMKALYDNSPRWSAAEMAVYGDLLFERVDS